MTAPFENSTMVDVICIAGDIRPFKAEDILSTTSMQSIRNALRWCQDREHIDSMLTAAALDWLREPVQLELPPEYRWKLAVDQLAGNP